ncbi:MAG: hypothetical protein WBK67_02970 [Minisyncoccales bacterium]
MKDIPDKSIVFFVNNFMSPSQPITTRLCFILIVVVEGFIAFIIFLSFQEDRMNNPKIK